MSLRVLVLALVLSGVASTSHAFPIEIVEYVDGGSKVVAFINQKDFSKTVPWRVFDEPPPLSVTQVTDIIKDYIAADGRLKGARLVEIVLRPIPHYEQHWHYMVKLRIASGGARHHRYFVILMNGKVIPAIREPSSLK